MHCAAAGEGSSEELAVELRRRLGPAPALPRWPRISIVVVNRNGADHLRRLVSGLERHTDYPDFELILVDNGSNDESLPFIRSVRTRFPISIVGNPHNESFSDACNQGAELAGGELLLFLNNDVEPFERGWLRELVACLDDGRPGIAGSTLICPSETARGGYVVQHRAMRLHDTGLLRPDLHGRGDDPLGEGLGRDAESPIAAGACILIERDLFARIGGFTHGYVYGGEDIDLGLKVLEQGRTILCSGRSLLIHRLGSTRSKEGSTWLHTIGRGNARLFWERWGPRLRREFELDRLEGSGAWAAPGESADRGPSRAEALALGFCLRSSEPATTPDPLDALRAELVRRGHRCLVLRGDNIDDLLGFNYDVAVYLDGPARYIPKPGQLNVLWAPSRNEPSTAIENRRYDLVLGDRTAPGALIDAVLSRAGEIGFQTRISVG